MSYITKVKYIKKSLLQAVTKLDELGCDEDKVLTDGDIELGDLDEILFLIEKSYTSLRSTYGGDELYPHKLRRPFNIDINFSTLPALLTAKYTMKTALITIWHKQL